ncbi:hypothetical protein DNX69_16795 [Rhodopseudomonas palustris]|uniref:Uncharacterized protein n=1 Tax=Rhodopseudomonas palustris TaxID=1076 RepID=A0A323UTV7_RHOPL|nr:hypothetical protein [Rhodopseudomonas palustris]PZA10988.1 hypothetical protein DNX69_16795 [Rhodopseudomonas palustris]
MIAEEDFAAAADCPPEMAFVRLERKFREILERNLNETDSGGAATHLVIEYMNHTLAAAEALRLDFLDFYAVPDENQSDVWSDYRRFRQAVDAFAVRIQISHLRVGPAYALPLDQNEKTHLRAYVTRIKEIIDQSSLVTAKKERLFDKLNAFLKELDRDRTALQKFNDVILSLANTGGEAAEGLEPAWKWAKLAAAVLGVRQETEQTKQLPPPKKAEAKRQLPPPTKKNSHVDIDDDIPF